MQQGQIVCSPGHRPELQITLPLPASPIFTHPIPTLLLRCLIVDEMHHSLVAMLAQIGVQGDYLPGITKAEVLERIGEYEGIIIRSKLRLNQAFFDRATRLRFIARAGAGLDGIDLAQAAARNIHLLHAPEGNRDAVAEHTVGMALALANRFCLGHNQVAAGQWHREANRGTEIGGKTFALIGYGYMGQATARRLQCFGCRVIAYDKYLTHWPDHNAEPATLEQVFAEADFVSLHIPLTPETRQWVTWRFLERFAKPIWLINTARGEIVDLLDLLYFIKRLKVRGAALDVLENEKLDQMLTSEKVVLQALAATCQVLFTPHVAGWTVESYIRINEVLVEKIRGLGFNPS